jgi:hypothetical protein
MDTIYFGVMNLLVFAVILLATRKPGQGKSPLDIFDLETPDSAALPDKAPRKSEGPHNQFARPGPGEHPSDDYPG